MDQDRAISVRGATLDDVEQLVKLHYLCFSAKEHLAMILGKSFMRDVYSWFATSDLTIALVAEQDGEFVGCHIACNGPYHQLMFANNRRSMVRAFFLRPWLIVHPQILKRIAGSLFTSNELEDRLKVDKDFALFALVGVHPDFRRSSVASKLIEETIERCRRRRWLKLRAVIYERNKASRRLMVNFGFTESKFPGDDKVILQMDLEA